MIYYVRHGQTDFNLFEITQGQKDVSLNERGLEQAQELAKKLKDCKFDYIFCSPLTRTRQTLEKLQVYHKNIEPIFDARLMEIAKGRLEGNKNSDETRIDFYKDPKKYGGETNEDVFNRVSSFLNDLQKYKNKNILIVGHGGILKFFDFCLSHKDIKKDKLNLINMENCEIVKFDF